MMLAATSRAKLWKQGDGWTVARNNKKEVRARVGVLIIGRSLEIDVSFRDVSPLKRLCVSLQYSALQTHSRQKVWYLTERIISLSLRRAFFLFLLC